MRYHLFKTLIITTAVALFICLLLSPESAYAQCSMCRQALETGGSGNLLSGLKWSIVFMIIPPTIMTAGIGFLVIKSGRNSADAIKPFDQSDQFDQLSD